MTPPKLVAPPGACDCHTHIFGPDEKFPLSPKRLYTPGPASIENLNDLHKAIHIDRVVVVRGVVVVQREQPRTRFTASVRAAKRECRGEGSVIVKFIVEFGRTQRRWTKPVGQIMQDSCLCQAEVDGIALSAQRCGDAQ